MKRLLFLILALGLLMGLSACGPWVKDDYSVITPHVEQPLPSQTPDREEPTPTVSSRTELRGAVLALIRDWTEQGTISLQGYQGNVSEDLEETLRYATQEDPIGAYAVDYMDAEFDGKNSISVNIVFRRSAAEVDSIVTVSGNSGAYGKIHQALAAYDMALTLRIRNYRETDFARYVYEYCLKNPGTMVALPTVSAEVYPKEGETRILELHFSYPASRDDMRLMQASVDTILSSAASYIRSGEDDLQRAQLLYRFLTTRFHYTPGEEVPHSPAYSLLCKGEAHSFSFAAVFYAECLGADMDCLLVKGEKDGADYYWNLLKIENRYYHVDLMRSMTQKESELRLLYTQELNVEGYRWEESLYPPTAVMETADPQPTEPTESTQPTESTEGTEPTESTENSTESTEPTESTAESSADTP